MLQGKSFGCGLALALVVLPLAAGAASNADVARAQAEFLQLHGERAIASVGVEGLHRTRPGVVAQWLVCMPGQPLSTCDLAAIHERLDRLGIFSEIDVGLADAPAGVDVTFRIEEKWTLYPVPMLWYTPGTELAGLVVAEANLLGYNKGLAVGGVYSNRGWYTIAGYNDPNIGFTQGWGSMHTFLGRSTVENDAPDGSIAQSFDMTRFDFEWSLGYTFWDRVSPTWNGSVRVGRVGALHLAGAEPPVDETVTAHAFQLIYSDRRLRWLFDEGLRVAGEVTHAFPLARGSDSYEVAILDADYAHRLPGDGSLEAVGRLHWGELPEVFEERLGGLEGSRTLPGSGLVAADRYGCVDVTWRQPLWTMSLGTLTGQTFAELGRYQRNSEAPATYGGPGLGLRFYVKQVAVPAFGVDVGYEAFSRRTSVSIAVGYRPMR